MTAPKATRPSGRFSRRRDRCGSRVAGPEGKAEAVLEILDLRGNRRSRRRCRGLGPAGRPTGAPRRGDRGGGPGWPPAGRVGQYHRCHSVGCVLRPRPHDLRNRLRRFRRDPVAPARRPARSRPPRSTSSIRQEPRSPIRQGPRPHAASCVSDLGWEHVVADLVGGQVEGADIGVVRRALDHVRPLVLLPADVAGEGLA